MWANKRPTKRNDGVHTIMKDSCENWRKIKNWSTKWKMKIYRHILEVRFSENIAKRKKELIRTIRNNESPEANTRAYRKRLGLWRKFKVKDSRDCETLSALTRNFAYTLLSWCHAAKNILDEIKFFWWIHQRNGSYVVS